jgi:hypothetical protein
MVDRWHYAVGSKVVGPLPLADLITILSRLPNAEEVFVWCRDFDHWERAANVPEIAIQIVRPPPLPRSKTPKQLPPLVADPSERMGIQLAADFGGQKRRRNFVAKNWRGEYPLWISYWVFGLLANVIAFGFAVVVAIVFTPTRGYNPISIIAALAITWIGIGSIVVWQLVSVWRSASRNAKWGVLAKIAVILGTIRALFDLVQVGYPQIQAAARMAFLGDPDVPDYALRIMRAGTEIEVSGGFKYGLNDDLVRVLDAAPQIKVVHLNSVGGRVGEAEKVFKTIQTRALATYTSYQCMSACTLAFAGGRERWLHAKAHMGFHAPSFPGMSEQDLQDAAQNSKEILLAAGIAPSFVSRALSTPSTSIWQPSQEELLTARVISGIADPYKFAASGFGSKVTRDVTSADFRKVPVYATLARVASKAFEQFADLWYEGYLAGKSEGELNDDVHAKIHPILLSYRPFADDQTTLEMGKLILSEMKVIAAKDKNACFDFASGVERSYANYLTPALSDQELALDARLLETAHERPMRDKRIFEATWAAVRSRLASRFGSKMSALAGTNVRPAQRADYCDISIALYEEVLSLAPAQAMPLLRDLLRSN